MAFWGGGRRRGLVRKCKWNQWHMSPLYFSSPPLSRLLSPSRSCLCSLTLPPHSPRLLMPPTPQTISLIPSILTFFVRSLIIKQQTRVLQNKVTISSTLRPAQRGTSRRRNKTNYTRLFQKFVSFVSAPFPQRILTRKTSQVRYPTYVLILYI